MTYTTGAAFVCSILRRPITRSPANMSAAPASTPDGTGILTPTVTPSLALAPSGVRLVGASIPSAGAVAGTAGTTAATTDIADQIEWAAAQSVVYTQVDSRAAASTAAVEAVAANSPALVWRPRGGEPRGCSPRFGFLAWTERNLQALAWVA